MYCRNGNGVKSSNEKDESETATTSPPARVAKAGMMSFAK